MKQTLIGGLYHMPIFDKIGEFAKNASEKAGEFAKNATEKAGDKIEITRLNAKIKTEQQTILGYKTELGARYWDRIAAGEIEADPSVEDIVGKIKASLANIAGIEAEIRKIEEERAAAEAAAKAAAEARSATIVVPPAPPAEPAQQSYAAQVPVYAAQPVEAQNVPVEFHTSAPVQGEYSFGVPVQPAQPAPAVPAGSALKCANCGAALNPGTKFCQECGTPAPAPAPAKRFCPNCGKDLPPEVRFCPECGTKA